MPRSSKRAVVASISMNFALVPNGDSGLRFASSSTSLAAAVLPTPGGPYMRTCWGFGPHSAALSAFNPSTWPTISPKLAGRVFSASGSVSEISRSRCSFSISFFDSRSTATRLPCWDRRRFQKYMPMTIAKKN